MKLKISLIFILLLVLILSSCKDKNITNKINKIMELSKESSQEVSSNTISSNTTISNTTIDSGNNVYISSNLSSNKNYISSNTASSNIQSSNISSSIISSEEVSSKVEEKMDANFLIKTHLKTVFEGNVDITDEVSVFAVLEKVCKDNNIQLSYSKSFGLAYIRSIDNLAEKSVNTESGWIYKVNGVKPSVGCSSYKLKSTDKVEWLYTLNYGKDVE